MEKILTTTQPDKPQTEQWMTELLNQIHMADSAADALIERLAPCLTESLNKCAEEDEPCTPLVPVANRLREATFLVRNICRALNEARQRCEL